MLSAQSSSYPCTPDTSIVVTVVLHYCALAAVGIRTGDEARERLGMYKDGIDRAKERLEAYRQLETRKKVRLALPCPASSPTITPLPHRGPSAHSHILPHAHAHAHAHARAHAHTHAHSRTCEPRRWLGWRWRSSGINSASIDNSCGRSSSASWDWCRTVRRQSRLGRRHGRPCRRGIGIRSRKSNRARRRFSRRPRKIRGTRCRPQWTGQAASAAACCLRTAASSTRL